MTGGSVGQQQGTQKEEGGKWGWWDEWKQEVTFGRVREQWRDGNNSNNNNKKKFHKQGLTLEQHLVTGVAE